ncbi:MAG: hypothetical protein ACOZQL_38665 [Myxococcota bacterium]
MQRCTSVDPVALRQELSLHEPIDPNSPTFIRFVIRLSERLDVDIAREDWPRLTTLSGCREYISRLG